MSADNILGICNICKREPSFLCREHFVAKILELEERAKKAEEGWIKAERRLGNCCPLCGSDTPRPGHLGCQCIKNIEAARKRRTAQPRSHCPFCAVGDPRPTCPRPSQPSPVVHPGEKP